MADGAEGLEPGAIFAGDYRIVRKLAQGGMGAVYVVDQLSTGKSRALKLMRPEVAHDADSRRRFELEAKVGAKIESEHVVEIHSAGVDFGTPYIVMELLDGEDLATRLERGAMDPADVRDIFEQLCHAVGAAHAAGIVHRDLKPENVFLARSKRAGGDSRTTVKVLDFGIAKLVAEVQTRGGKTQGMIGTPMWMAPEQTDLVKVTPAADVWALGLILYSMLTGRIFWLSASLPDSTLTQLLKEMVMGPLPPASARARQQGVGGSIRPEIDSVLGRCIIRDPSRRYPNANELWKAVSSALAPTSARIVAAGPASGVDHTVAQAPLGAVSGGTSPMSVPRVRTDMAPAAQPISVPRFEAQPFVHEPAMSSSVWWRNVNPRLFAIPAVLMIIFIQQCASRTIRSAAERRAEQAERERQSRILTLPTGPTVLPAAKASPRGDDNKACRVCATSVVASGPVPQDAIVAAIDAALPTFDQQCITGRTRRRTAGTVTFEFVVRDGRATNRKIERSSATDGTDECLLRALADLAFPSSPDETQVTAHFSYNPFAR